MSKRPTPPTGHTDTLHMKELFFSNNAWEIPDLAPATSQEPLPTWLAPYRSRIRPNDADLSTGAVHFFTDDHLFEAVWTRPQRGLQAVAHFGTALSPDFSLYADWPLAAQIWNTYRSRWCAAYWQRHGLRVIPSVSWSDSRSYTFCFAGLPRGGVVAVSTIGFHRTSAKAKQLFLAGYAELIVQVAPEMVVCYGTPFEEMEATAQLAVYPSTAWTNIRAARKQGVKQNGR